MCDASSTPPQPASPTGLYSVSIFPVLSWNESSLTPTASSSVRCRFASGDGSAYLMWRPPLTLPGRAAGNDDRQVHVIVDVRIAHAAAVEVERVVEQRAVALADAS